MVRRKKGDYKTDYQKQDVYAWEREAIAPHDLSHIPFEQVQSIINFIWEGEGLKYPPLVQRLSGAQRIGALARANRHAVWIREEGLPTWVLLHELAHSMTCDHSEDQEICGHHGKSFVGVYMKLVFKWLFITPNVAIYLANKHNVQYDLNAKPIFVD